MKNWMRPRSRVVKPITSLEVMMHLHKIHTSVDLGGTAMYFWNPNTEKLEEKTLPEDIANEIAHHFENESVPEFDEGDRIRAAALGVIL
jgi:hypothetical protein